MQKAPRQQRVGPAIESGTGRGVHEWKEMSRVRMKYIENLLRADEPIGCSHRDFFDRRLGDADGASRYRGQLLPARIKTVVTSFIYR